MATPISRGNFEAWCSNIPFLHPCYDSDCTLAELLMNFVFHLQIFEAPGDGVWHQLIGMAMGTNSAPGWANLILRYFELSPPPPPPTACWRLFACLEVH